jgi:hypothetical protein
MLKETAQRAKSLLVILSVGLLITACGGGTSTTTSDTSREAAVLDLTVVGPTDRTLTDGEIRGLLSGKTVTTQNFDDATKIQVGVFSADGRLSVAASGQKFQGKWTTANNQVCYDLGGRNICSSIHLSEFTYGNKAIYYFRRQSEPNSGQATVVVVSVSIF